MALWESLTDAERDTELALSVEEQAELDRRWTEHIEDPSSAVPWAVPGTKAVAKGLARSSAPPSSTLSIELRAPLRPPHTCAIIEA
jgi:hypothetical protein